MTRISRIAALELMKGNKGRFFTVTFKKVKGEVRTMNCRYMDNTELGYARVVETKSKTIKNVNLQTISALKINKTSHTIA